MYRVLENMRRLGVDRGLFEGRRIWLILGAAAWTIKAIQWVAKRDDPVVFQGVVTEGERLLITATDPAQLGRRRHRRSSGHH